MTILSMAISMSISISISMSMSISKMNWFNHKLAQIGTNLETL
jgi:hypothetical protein